MRLPPLLSCLGAVPPRLGAMALVGFTITATGCQCGEDRPYTPFQVTTSLPEESRAPVAPATPESSEPARRVIRAPEELARWAPFGTELSAPAGLRFHSAVEGPPPGSTADDARSSPRRSTFVWLAPPSSSGQLGGQLVEFEPSGKSHSVLAPRPAFLPAGGGCRDEVALEAVGSDGVSVAIDVACEGTQLPGTPVGAWLVAESRGESRGGETGREGQAPVRLLLRRLGDPPGEKLTGSFARPDLDRDGRPDVELTLTLTGPNRKKASLTIPWIDRPLGLSRVQGEPRAGLERRVAELLGMVPRKKERDDAMAELDAFRRLLYAVCAESKAPRVIDEARDGLDCDLEQVPESVTLGLIDGFVYRDELVRALGEYHRAPLSFSAPSRTAEERFRKALARSTTFRTAVVAEAHELPPLPSEAAPTASPLRFDESGRLFALAGGGDVVLLSASPGSMEDGEASEAEAASREDRTLETWARRPTSQTGNMLASVIPSCHRAELELAFERSSGAPRPNLALPLFAPRPGACGTFGPPLVEAEPIRWAGEELLAIIGGELVDTSGRLPDDAAPLAYPTRAGLAIWRGAAKLELWTNEAASGAHHCALRRDGQLAACVHGTRAVVFRPTE